MQNAICQDYRSSKNIGVFCDIAARNLVLTKQGFDVINQR